jgi:hypothetical protein
VIADFRMRDCEAGSAALELVKDARELMEAAVAAEVVEAKEAA